MATLTCFNCNGTLQDVVLPFSRRADCPHCRAELHCCLMCTQFDARSKEQCREERAEPPTRKDIANFCEWFTPAAGRSAATTPARRAQAHLDALFDGGPESDAGTGLGAAAEQGDGADATPAPEPEHPQGQEHPQDQEHPEAPDLPLSPEEEARRRLDDLFR